MSSTITVKGVDQVCANINKFIAKHKQVTDAALIKAGKIVFRAAKLKTPVDLGNLMGSAFVIWDSNLEIPTSPSHTGNKDHVMTPAQVAEYESGCERVAEEARALVKSGGSNRTVVVVGFSAYYAIFVHENKEANHTVGEWKFLEHALQEKEETILTMLKNTVAANISNTKYK